MEIEEAIYQAELDIRRNLPAVLVLMPAWDPSGPYMKEAARSWAGQTYPNTHFAAVSDGLTGDNLKLFFGLESMFADGQVHYHHVRSLKKNIGKIRALQYAVNELDELLDSMDFVIVGDADDVAPPWMVERSVHNMLAYRILDPMVVVVYSPNILIDKEGVIIGAGDPQKYSKRDYNVRTDKNFLPCYGITTRDRFVKISDMDEDLSGTGVGDKKVMFLEILEGDHTAIRYDEPSMPAMFYRRHDNCKSPKPGKSLSFLPVEERTVHHTEFVTWVPERRAEYWSHLPKNNLNWQSPAGL